MEKYLFDFKAFREKLDVSQRDLADKLGLSRSEISRMEGGYRSVGKALIDRILSEYSAEKVNDFIKPLSGMDVTKERTKVLDNVRQIRTKKGLGQVDVATHLGISREAYALIESGQRRLHYDALLGIADAFDMHVVDVILWPDGYPQPTGVVNELVERKYQELVEKYVTLSEKYAKSQEDLIDIYKSIPTNTPARFSFEDEEDKKRELVAG